MAETIQRTPGIELYAVASRSVERASALNPLVVYDEYAQLLADPKVDLVYIVLSNDLHFPWVMAAIAAGKNVLCEKPLGLDAEEAAFMFDAADAMGVQLFEGYWHLWHPRMDMVRALLATGAIGELVGVDSGFTHHTDFSSNFRNDPALGGGMLLDLGCYPLAAILSLMPAVAVVDAVIVEQEMSSAGADLHVMASLTLTNNVRVTLTVSSQRPERRWFEIFGTAGHIKFSEPAFSHYPEPETGTQVMVSNEEGEQSWHVPAADPRSVMLLEISDSLKERKTLPVSPHLSILVAHAIAETHKVMRNRTTF